MNRISFERIKINLQVQDAFALKASDRSARFPILLSSYRLLKLRSGISRIDVPKYYYFRINI